MTDPIESIDAEVLKEKLESIAEAQQRIEGKLEALQASIDSLAGAGWQPQLKKGSVPNES